MTAILFIQQKMAPSYEASRFSSQKSSVVKEARFAPLMAWHFPCEVGCFQWFAESQEKHEQAFLIGSRMLGAGSLSRSAQYLYWYICSIWWQSPNQLPIIFAPTLRFDIGCLPCLVLRIANGGVS
jgi:hypothetical protein